DVDLDQVDAGQVERVERHLLHRRHLVVAIVDRLADELVVRTLLQFQAAEAARRLVIGAGNFHDARLGRYRAVNGDGVEAVVERDIAGERVIDALLGLDGDDLAPAGHGGRPFQRVYADISAAVDADDAVAVELAPQHQQFHGQFALDGVVRALIEDLEADAGADIVDHTVVETVDDHRAVVRRSEHEDELACGLKHADLEVWEDGGTRHDWGT